MEIDLKRICIVDIMQKDLYLKIGHREDGGHSWLRAIIFYRRCLLRLAGMEDFEPCDIASMNENIAAAVEAIGPWLRREGRFG